MELFTFPPDPRPEGAPPLNSQSTPKSIWSVSTTDAMVTSIATCRGGTSSFFSAASMMRYSCAVAMTSSVLLSLSATTWMLRTMPRPSAVARPCRVAPDACGCVGVCVCTVIVG